MKKQRLCLMSSVHERLTVARSEPEASEAATDTSVGQNGWLTFEAYVAWVAAMNGVSSTALSSPPPEDGERTVEDRRSTLIVPARRRHRRFAWSMRSAPMLPSMRRHRLSATVLRRVLSKTG